MSGDESPPRKVSVEQLAAEDERKLFVGGGSRNTTENTMFVGGLPNETKHEDLKTHFARYGAVEKVKLMSDQATGRFKGFGFVIFETVDGYNAALEHPEQQLLGRTVTCKEATVKVKQGKIYIGKLPADSCFESDIREHFAQFGPIVEVVRPADKLKGDELKPFAFVTFEREEIARKLVKLGGDVMCGIRINIKPVITKDPSAAPYGPARPQPGGGGSILGHQPQPPRPGQPPNPNWAAPAAPTANYGYGGAQGYGAAYGGYGGGYGGYGSYGAAGGEYDYGATGAAAAPVAPAASGANVPSLASFNPYDISSYGGGKMGGPTPGAGARPSPY